MNTNLTTKPAKNYKILAKRKTDESVLDALLISRGITNKEEFLNPLGLELMSPYCFSDMKKAVDIVKSAILNNEKILVWGDFDCDGVTSTSIMYKTLKALGANFSYFIPDRMTLGHGINLKELLLQKSKNNVKVLITVDCGISNLKEIELIKNLSVKTIITDHHEPPKVLPPADCILNPLADNALKPDLKVSDIEKFSYMSGAGVAMKLSYALLDEFSNENSDYSALKNEIIALCALGTIADVVPLVGENRTIAAYGLRAINNGCHKGIKKLFQSQNKTTEITSEDIAFILAPRINAAGRLDSPYEAFKLLVEENEITLDVAIEKLNSLNSIRQNLCDKTYTEALSMLNRPKNCIVLYNPNWHIGIIGIVASKLVEKFNLPVFLMTSDEKQAYRCSIRGVESVDIAKVLQNLSDTLLGFGGHSLAGGFSADMETVEFDYLKKRIETAVIDSKDESKLSNELIIDMELNADDIQKSLIDEIKLLEPFGANNKKPVFLFKDAKLCRSRVIGKEQNHMAYSILKDNKEFNCLYWKRPVLGFETGEFLDVVFTPEINIFNDEERIQLITECILNDKLSDNFSTKIKIFDHRQKTGILDKINEYINSKQGEVKVWATTISQKKELEKYKFINENILTPESYQAKSIMLFDYPPNCDVFSELMERFSPLCVHFMNSNFSKNPDDAFKTIIGMVKYAANNKNGIVEIKTIADATGLDEITIQAALELLEKTGSIRILDINKFEFIKAPSIENLHDDSSFELFYDEFKRVISFKEYIKTAEIDTLEKLCTTGF